MSQLPIIVSVAIAGSVSIVASSGYFLHRSLVATSVETRQIVAKRWFKTWVQLTVSTVAIISVAHIFFTSVLRH